MQSLLRDLSSKVTSLRNQTSVGGASPAGNGGCTCSDATYTCKCCVDVPLVTSLSPACASVTYVPSKLSIDVAVTLNGNVVFHQSISAKDPPPVCFNIPFVEGTQACLDIYDLYLDKDEFKACIKLTVKWQSMPFDLDLGCFSFPLHAIYREYMEREMGIPDADTRILDQWYMALLKAQIIKKMQLAINQQ